MAKETWSLNNSSWSTVQALFSTITALDIGEYYRYLDLLVEFSVCAVGNDVWDCGLEIMETKEPLIRLNGCIARVFSLLAQY